MQTLRSGSLARVLHPLSCATGVNPRETTRAFRAASLPTRRRTAALPPPPAVQPNLPLAIARRIWPLRRPRPGRARRPAQGPEPSSGQHLRLIRRRRALEPGAEPGFEYRGGNRQN
jgi:hypothetical protein